jgi:signal transduction histidine kinase
MIQWIPWFTSAIAIGLSLLTTYILAHGATAAAAADDRRRPRHGAGRLHPRVRETVTGRGRACWRTPSTRCRPTWPPPTSTGRELIANVSHELRTPITALQAVLENIVDGVAEPDPTTLRTALAQTERLGRLVTELLDLSRIDAGAHRLELASFAVRPFVDEVMAEAKVVSAGARQDVHFGHSVSPPESTVVGDRERLKQVVLNLLDNAARHSPVGGRVLLTACERDDALVLEVSDEGPGIAAAERERVFERFTRGEPATGGGTGLGLAIARWVVSLHGGSIAVVDPGSPRPRSGCRMRWSYPPRRPEAPHPQNGSTHVRQQPQPGRRLGAR